MHFWLRHKGQRYTTLWLFSRNKITLQREGFGSFHSDDIEKLVRLPEHEYRTPKCLVERLETLSHQDNSACSFGAKFKREFFHLDPSWVFLNHGAFGGVLKPVLREANYWRERCEQQPLRFFDRDLLPMIAHSVRVMAKYLSCPPEELLPLPNVTSGLNAVMQSLPLQPHDEIIYFSLTYGSTKKILADLSSRTGAALRLVDISLPIHSTEEDIILPLYRALNDKSKVIIIDQITSNSALELPVMQIASICKAKGILVIVDAAHALFTIPSSLPLPAIDREANIDVWLTNGHKWLCAAKGCAFMWVNPITMRDSLRPAIISHGHSTNDNPRRLLSAFAWDGCRDYAAMITVPTAIDFWEQIREPQEYMRGLISDGDKLLRDAWDIHPDDIPCPAEMVHKLPMRLVPLPARLKGIDTKRGNSDKEAFFLQEWLHHEHQIEVPVKHFSGRLFIRVSAHVYNSLEDFRILAKAISVAKS